MDIEDHLTNVRVYLNKLYKCVLSQDAKDYIHQEVLSLENDLADLLMEIKNAEN